MTVRWGDLHWHIEEQSILSLKGESQLSRVSYPQELAPVLSEIEGLLLKRISKGIVAMRQGDPKTSVIARKLAADEAIS